jgi:hypothetical protein
MLAGWPARSERAKVAGSICKGSDVLLAAGVLAMVAGLAGEGKLEDPPSSVD